MPNTGDVLIVNASAGLSLRDGPDVRGSILRTLGNESRVTILEQPYHVSSPFLWLYVEAHDGLRGWIIAKDDKDNTFVKSSPQYVKVRRNRTRKNRRNTKGGYR